MTRTFNEVAQNYYAQMLPAESKARQRLEKIYDRTPVELTSLYEEIAVSRMAAEDALQLFAAADELPQDRQLIAKAAAYDLMHKVFGQIAKLSESASKIDQLNRTSSSLQLARVIIDEAIVTAQAIMGAYVPPEILSVFAKRLRESFEIDSPTAGTRRVADAEKLVDQMDQLTQPTA